jgi:TRAP-type C4-dicarboxylate transport system substrate-binding protein
MLVGGFNDKYSTLNENDKKTLKTLIESSDDDKKELYSKTLKECLALVNKRLETNDVELKEKLLKVKEKLLSENLESNEDIEKKLIKIADLTNILGTD